MSLILLAVCAMGTKRWSQYWKVLILEMSSFSEFTKKFSEDVNGGGEGADGISVARVGG